MIERNLGNLERVTRLLAGVALLIWALLQGSLNGIEWFVIAMTAALIFNGLFSRCYLWYILDIDTRNGKAQDPDRTFCY